eukprot:76380_1
MQNINVNDPNLGQTHPNLLPWVRDMRAAGYTPQQMQHYFALQVQSQLRRPQHQQQPHPQTRIPQQQRQQTHPQAQQHQQQHMPPIQRQISNHNPGVTTPKKRYSIQIMLMQNVNENEKYEDLGKILMAVNEDILCREFVTEAKKKIDLKVKHKWELSYDLNGDETKNGLTLFIRAAEDDDITDPHKWFEMVDDNEPVKDYVQEGEVIVFLFRLLPDIPIAPMISNLILSNNNNSNINNNHVDSIKLVYFDHECTIKETLQPFSETAITEFIDSISSENNMTNHYTFDLFITAGFPFNNSDLLALCKENDTVYISPRWKEHQDAFILPYRAPDEQKSKQSKHDIVYTTISDTLRLSADWMPVVAQTRKGMTSFLSCLYTITMSNVKNKHKLLGKLRHCLRQEKWKYPPGLLSMKILLEQRVNQLTKHHKAVISNLFYLIFRMIIPNKMCNDNRKVFQYSHIIMSHLLGECTKDSLKRFEKYKSIQLKKPSVFRRRSVEDSSDSLKNVDKAWIAVLKRMYPHSDDVYVWDYTELQGGKEENDDDIEMIDAPTEVWDESKWTALTTSIGNGEYNKMMRVVPTLSLKRLSCSSFALTLDNEGDLCVLCGSVKDDVNTRQFYCPLRRDIYQCDLDELAKQIHELDLNINEITGYVDDGDVVDDRQPLEAVMVVLDRSHSMTDSFFGNRDVDMCRLDIVKQYFDAFLNRSKAYDYANHIGLILFGSKIEIKCNISPLYEKFRDKINEIEVEGRTALRDAIKQAAAELNKWKTQYSNRRNCNLRIIALTDGLDSRSTTKEDELLDILISSAITADCIMIGHYNRALHKICDSTGGYVFYPKTFHDGLRIFELETFLSITERGDLKDRKNRYRQHGSRSRMHYESNVDICDAYQVPKGKTIEHFNVATVSLRSKIRSINHGGMEHKEEEENESQSDYATPMKRKKVLREMSNIMNDPHPFWNIFVDDKNIFFWKLLLSGPPQTPYEGGTFVLYLDLRGEYPQKAPKMRFITPIKHVNVNTYGRICHSIFDRNYTPDVKIRGILNVVYGLLLNPDWDDPLDSVLRQEYADNPELFRWSVKAHVQQYAMSKTRAEMMKELSGQSRKRNLSNMMMTGYDTNNAKKRRLR